MEFRFEREMAPIVYRWLTSNGLIPKQEFVAPWGICDFVGVRLNQVRVRKRLALGQTRPIGPVSRIRLLQAIPDKDSGRVVTTSRLQREFRHSFSSERLLEEVEKLVATRFAAFAARGRLHRLNGWEPLHRRIVAVELKLSRPQDAFNQAISHLAFADETFVALPLSLATRLCHGSRYEEFWKRGVGVLGVDGSTCHLVRRPSGRRFAVDPALQMLCVERFWRMRSTDTAT